jgi:hypothetical protein
VGSLLRLPHRSQINERRTRRISSDQLPIHNRRATAADAPGVTWIHGSNIGMAESSDGGATWTYRGI